MEADLFTESFRSADVLWPFVFLISLFALFINVTILAKTAPPVSACRIEIMLHEKTDPAAHGSRAGVSVVEHPLVAARLAVLRAKTTVPDLFRRTLEEISAMLAFEATRQWETRPIEIETPLATCPAVLLRRPIVLVPILRAGLGMAEAILRILPEASVGHLGLYRDKKTLRPVSYYRRLPATLAEAEVLLLDPMLATGFSASEAVTILKAEGATRIRFLCLVSCEAGIAQLHSAHPELEITTAAIDQALDEFAYIVPGLGDAGDRYFGTD